MKHYILLVAVLFVFGCQPQPTVIHDTTIIEKHDRPRPEMKIEVRPSHPAPPPPRPEFRLEIAPQQPHYHPAPPPPHHPQPAPPQHRPEVKPQFKLDINIK